MQVWISRKVRRRAARSFGNNVSRPSLLVSHFLLVRTYPHAYPRSLVGDADICAYVLGPKVSVAAPKARHSTKTKRGSRPTSLQLLTNNVLPKVELRSHHYPHAVTTAVQYIREIIIVNKVGGDTKTKSWGDLPGNPASKAVKHYVVRCGRLPVQEAADKLSDVWVVGLGRENPVQ